MRERESHCIHTHCQSIIGESDGEEDLGERGSRSSANSEVSGHRDSREVDEEDEEDEGRLHHPHRGIIGIMWISGSRCLWEDW